MASGVSIPSRPFSPKRLLYAGWAILFSLYEDMSSATRMSPKDIQVVQNLVERCLQLYTDQREVVKTLLAQAKIEPGFTELVWQKLEEENREFFKAYDLRLTVKHQVMEFNKLLELQVQLMNSAGLPYV